MLILNSQIIQQNLFGMANTICRQQRCCQGPNKKENRQKNIKFLKKCINKSKSTFAGQIKQYLEVDDPFIFCQPDVDEQQSPLLPYQIKFERIIKNSNYYAWKMPEKYPNKGIIFIFDYLYYEGGLNQSNLAHGNGSLQFIDSKSWYDGSFVENMISGKGVWEKNQDDYKQRFSGEWNHGYPSYGTYRYRSKDSKDRELQIKKFQPIFQQNSTIKNKFYAKIFFKNENYGYNGEVRYYNYDQQFQFSGQGQIFLPDGSNYCGQFQKGQFNGRGKYIYHDGNIYEGEFKNGQKHGQGVFYWKQQKKKYKGFWYQNQIIKNCSQIKDKDLRKELIDQINNEDD